MDRGALEAALREAEAGRAVTHIFHCAYLMKADQGEESEVGKEVCLQLVWHEE